LKFSSAYSNTIYVINLCITISLLLRRTLVPPLHYSTECFSGITPEALIQIELYSAPTPFNHLHIQSLRHPRPNGSAGRASREGINNFFKYHSLSFNKSFQKAGLRHAVPPSGGGGGCSSVNIRYHQIQCTHHGNQVTDLTTTGYMIQYTQIAETR